MDDESSTERVEKMTLHKILFLDPFCCLFVSQVLFPLPAIFAPDSRNLFALYLSSIFFVGVPDKEGEDLNSVSVLFVYPAARLFLLL